MHLRANHATELTWGEQARKLLLKYKIPLRKRSERYESRWLAYGKRRSSGKIVDHKGELRTIATIKQMYVEGMSIAAIARFLAHHEDPY